MAVLCLFLLAAGMTAYPYIANFLFEHRNDSLVDTVLQTVDAVGEAEAQRMLEEAHAYNKTLSEGHIRLRDPFETEAEGLSEMKYHSLLNAGGDGVMGLVEIPAIDVRLPIFHSTSEEVLEQGIGHLEGTSLPVGGAGTNCVLTGHTGLSNAKLFTDLTELAEGDYFFLWVLGERMAYQVDKISVGLPNELDELYPIDGMDICTLVTCTPYGINSHRLLVRGVRTDYQEAVTDPAVMQRKQVSSRWMAEYQRALLISVGCFAFGLTLFFGFRLIAGARKKRRKVRR